MKFKVGHGHPALSAARLRSTWLVHHLTVGTRLPELMRAAGLTGVTVLSDLLADVPVLEDEQAAVMLRGGRGSGGRGAAPGGGAWPGGTRAHTRPHARS